MSPTRWRNSRLSSLPGWCRTTPSQAELDRKLRARRLPALLIPCSRRLAPLS